MPDEMYHILIKPSSDGLQGLELLVQEFFIIKTQFHSDRSQPRILVRIPGRFYLPFFHGSTAPALSLGTSLFLLVCLPSVKKSHCITFPGNNYLLYPVCFCQSGSYPVPFSEIIFMWPQASERSTGGTSSSFTTLPMSSVIASPPPAPPSGIFVK